MLSVTDGQIRLALLSHVAVRLAESPHEQVRAFGVSSDELGQLRHLSAVDLTRLASLRNLKISVQIDVTGLKNGLRTVVLSQEVKALETYFIQHGASWHMMRNLFKLRRKATHRRRWDMGAWRPSGRTRLPEYSMRERIYHAWLAIPDADPRRRYYRLHQKFQSVAIAVLEAVVKEFDSYR